MSLIAQEPRGLSCGKLLWRDSSEAQEELQLWFTEKGRSSSVPAIDSVEIDEEEIAKPRLLARWGVQNEPVLTLVDTGAIPNVLSKEFVYYLSLLIKLTRRTIRGFCGQHSRCAGVVEPEVRESCSHYSLFPIAAWKPSLLCVAVRGKAKTNRFWHFCTAQCLQRTGFTVRSPRASISQVKTISSPSTLTQTSNFQKNSYRPRRSLRLLVPPPPSSPLKPFTPPFVLPSPEPI